MDPTCDYLFKILIVGESGVGKSNLLLRFVDNKFEPSHISTIGVDFKIKTFMVGDQTIKMQIWDTAGHERFRSVVASYYRGAHGALIVYDVGNEESFNSVNDWVKELDQAAPAEAVRCIVGNK